MATGGRSQKANSIGDILLHYVFQEKSYGRWKASCVPRRPRGAANSGLRMVVPRFFNIVSYSAVRNQASDV
jgi:hypothetical protein